MAKAASERHTLLSLHTRLRHLEHGLDHLKKEQERQAMTAADLQAAIDALKQSVVKIQDQIAKLQNQPQLIDQAQLDANAADVKAASDTLNAL